MKFIINDKEVSLANIVEVYNTDKSLLFTGSITDLKVVSETDMAGVTVRCYFSLIATEFEK